MCVCVRARARTFVFGSSPHPTATQEIAWRRPTTTTGKFRPLPSECTSRVINNTSAVQKKQRTEGATVATYCIRPGTRPVDIFSDSNLKYPITRAALGLPASSDCSSQASTVVIVVTVPHWKELANA